MGLWCEPTAVYINNDALVCNYSYSSDEAEFELMAMAGKGGQLQKDWISMHAHLCVIA